MKIETPVREVYHSEALSKLKEQVVRESYHLKGPFSFKNDTKGPNNPIKITLMPSEKQNGAQDDLLEFQTFLEYESANSWIAYIRPIVPGWAASYIVWKVKRKIRRLKEHQKFKITFVP